MKKRPLIVPIFIPNQGCPYRCIYCQQEKITSQSFQDVNASTIARTLDQAVQSHRFDPIRKPEVAFLGDIYEIDDDPDEGIIGGRKALPATGSL